MKLSDKCYYISIVFGIIGLISLVHYSFWLSLAVVTIYISYAFSELGAAAEKDEKKVTKVS